MRDAMVGKVFGRLTCIGVDEERTDRKHTYVRCQCTCGNIKTVYRSNLTNGTVRSCGCLLAEIRKDGKGKPVYHKYPEYPAWLRIRNRCVNPRYFSYRLYGGRGIRIHQTWLKSFANFYADVGPRPSPRHQLARKDTDGPYAPGNCLWVLGTQRVREQSNSRLITHNGVTQSLSWWSLQSGISRRCITDRLEAGWSTHDALTTATKPFFRRPVKQKRGVQ